MSDPGPRTCRSMDPRFTTSVHTVPRSTEGAAGFSLMTPIESATINTTPTPNRTIWRRRFWSLNSGRAMSITLLVSNQCATFQKSQLVKTQKITTYQEYRSRLQCPLPNEGVHDRTTLIRAATFCLEPGTAHLDPR